MDQIKPENSQINKLRIVATPIGNLKDITLRALEVLKESDIILSEDTRETDKLLRHYDISGKENISYRDQNHDRVFRGILASIKAGKRLCLVSDSGMPLISDPGFKLVRGLLEEGLEVEIIPGPSAVIASVAMSGLPSDKFTFLGFLPRKPGDREHLLKEYGNLANTVVIYESPFRIIKLLEEIHTHLGNRTVCLINDITKMYEKTWRGNVESVINELNNKKLKGEFCVLIAKEGI